MDETEDATRRTRLANERTYLAWWRSGLTALAVSFGVGKLVPELAGGAHLPFQLVGAGFALLGVAFVAYGLVRHRAVDDALRHGEYARLDDRVALVFTVAGAVLGLATLALLFVDA